MSEQQRFDVVVVGGGPGGYVAAIRAAQLGLSTAVVEAQHMGGICLNWGCIPTKALLRSAEVYRTIRHAKDYGIKVDGASCDLTAVVARSRAVSDRLSKGVEFLMKKNKVTVLRGYGKLAGTAGARTIEVREKDRLTATLQAANIILATGARARIIPGFEPDGQHVWTYREAMVPTALPKSIAVVGSGAIGIEFASFYRAMGVEVTVFEMASTILPLEDAEISGVARKAMEKDGIRFHTDAKVVKLDRSKSNVTLHVELQGKAQAFTVDKVIMAVGIVGNVENLGLEGTAIKVEKTHIVVSEGCRTGEKGVYAIGDVAGPPWLAHKASHEGVHVAELIAGKATPHAIDPAMVPSCTYGYPQVASVGLTEEAAKKLQRKVKVGKFPLVGNGKALAYGEAEGMIKTIFDEKTGEVLGVHMVGPEVTEMVHSYVLARSSELTEADLFHAIFPHPTISEALHEAALAAYGRALHV